MKATTSNIKSVPEPIAKFQAVSARLDAALKTHNEIGTHIERVRQSVIELQSRFIVSPSMELAKQISNARAERVNLEAARHELLGTSLSATRELITSSDEAIQALDGALAHNEGCLKERIETFEAKEREQLAAAGIAPAGDHPALAPLKARLAELREARSFISAWNDGVEFSEDPWKKFAHLVKCV